MVYTGDCLEILPTLDAESVQCCVTSPPYYGLRNYGCEGQIGLESTPEAYVEKLVAVFREVRRVLRDDGTVWLNLGDSYRASGGDYKNGSQGVTSIVGHTSPESCPETGRMARAKASGLKPKDLIGIPWRVAFALQQPYYTGKIRNEADRIWLAAMIDGEGCFFIHKRKAGTPSYSKFTRTDGSEVNYERTADTYGVGLEICNTNKAIIDRIAAIVGGGTFTEQNPQQNNRRKQTIYRWRVAPNEAKRIAQEIYPHLIAKQHQARLLFACPSNGDNGAAAHQAMMDLHNGIETSVDYPAPPSMFEPGWYLRQDCIWSKPNCMPESVTDRCTKSHEYIFLLTKSARYFYDAEAVKEEANYDGRKDTIMKGSDKYKTSVVPGQAEHTMAAQGHERWQWENGVAYRNRRSVWTITTKPFKEAHFAVFPPEIPEICIKAGSKVGDTVLDPFSGAGTTGLVAEKLGRKFIGIELNPSYVTMSQKRIEAECGGLFADQG
jgi:DNA modification methylase